MRRPTIALCALVVALGFAEPSSAIILYYSNGYLELYWWGSDPDPAYYVFDDQDGDLWLREPGLWDARYQRYGGGSADIPEVSAYSMYSGTFHLMLRGRSPTRTCYFNNVNTPENEVELLLLEGGSVRPGVTFLAPNSDIVDSRIEGNVAGTIDVRRIAHEVAAHDLTIEGNLTGVCHARNQLTADAKLWIKGDVRDGGKLVIDGDVNGQIDIDGSVINSSGVEIDIGGKLASSGVLDIGLDLTGNVAVAGDIEAGIAIGHEVSGTIETQGTLTGTVTIGHGLSGEITAGQNLSGDILAGQVLSGEIATPGNMYSGARIEVGSVAATGSVDVSGRMYGDIDVDGSFSGSITVGQDLMSAGDITLGSMADGSQVAIGEDLAGEITVAGGVSGALDVFESLGQGGSITVGSMTSGSNSRVRVYKGHSGQVAVSGDMDSLIQLNYAMGNTVAFQCK